MLGRYLRTQTDMQNGERWGRVASRHGQEDVHANMHYIDTITIRSAKQVHAV